MSQPCLFTWLLSELVLLSALIPSVMTSDKHNFILHYPIDTAAPKAALLSLPASNHWPFDAPLSHYNTVRGRLECHSKLNATNLDYVNPENSLHGQEVSLEINITFITKGVDRKTTGHMLLSQAYLTLPKSCAS